MVNWTTENEAKLFGLILKYTEPKITGDILKKCAEEMGDGCTPKAITHRIAKVKSAAGKVTETASSNKEGTTPKATPTKAKAPSTPSGKGKKRNELADERDDDEDLLLSPSPTKKVKKEKKPIKKESSPTAEETDEVVQTRP